MLHVRGQCCHGTICYYQIAIYAILHLGKISSYPVEIWTLHSSVIPCWLWLSWLKYPVWVFEARWLVSGINGLRKAVSLYITCVYYYQYLLLPGIMETAQSLPDGCASICSFCSRMKRGRIYHTARREGYNVLALGQHLDDLAERWDQSSMRVINRSIN